jgi:hypothetical protein
MNYEAKPLTEEEETDGEGDEIVNGSVFLIKDNCLTEREPEEYDENGTGRTLT